MFIATIPLYVQNIQMRGEKNIMCKIKYLTDFPIYIDVKMFDDDVFKSALISVALIKLKCWNIKVRILCSIC